ncbi:MAG: type II secretion system protein GspM [Polyangiales bacterium]
MNELLDRMRGIWDGFNEREKGMVMVLGVIAAVCLLALPLFLTAHKNAEIADDNVQLRAALEMIGGKRAQLVQLAEARKAASQRYTRHTPPLGTFLEGKAKEKKLTIREITDQPEKVSGNYKRRSVRASISDVGLTGLVELLDGIVTSEYPVAVDQVQIEHYQPGDTYRFKLGVLTFDRKEGKTTGTKSTSANGPSPSDG